MTSVRQLTVRPALVLVASLAFGAALVLATAEPARAQSGASEDHSEPPAESDEEGADEDAEARAHFEAVTEYFDNTEYEDALVEFRQAYARASPAARPAMLFNIAAALERLGRFDESADTLERYLAEAEEPVSPARLRARIVSLRRRSEANRAPDEANASDGLIVGGAVALALAGAGLVSFGVFGGLALAEDGALEEGCFATRSCTPDDVAGLETLTLVADISWITAAVAGATGAVLLIVGLSTEDDTNAVSVVPFVGPATAGVSASGAF